MPEPGITEAELDGLLYQCPDQVRHIVVKLAVAAGLMEQPRDRSTCPCCGDSKPGQRELDIAEGGGGV